MPELQVKAREDRLPSGEAVVTGQVIGSINTSNIYDFETQIKVFTDKGLRLICLDLAKLDYINSTGLGLLVKISDGLSEKGGRMHLYNLPPNIESVLSMLGLTDIIRIYKSREDAMKAFREAPKTAAGTGDFPLMVSCSSCGTDLEFEAAGAFRCPVCNQYFEVKDKSNIETHPSARLRFIEMKVPLDAEFISSLQTVTQALLKNVGLPEAVQETLGRIMDEFCSYLILKNSAKGQTLPLLHLILIADRSEVRLAFRGQSKLIKDIDHELKTELSLKLIANLCDAIKAVDLPKGGQVVTIAKTVEATPDKSEDA